MPTEKRSGRTTAPPVDSKVLQFVSSAATRSSPELLHRASIKMGLLLSVTVPCHLNEAEMP